jgi:hypothetical protein
MICINQQTPAEQASTIRAALERLAHKRFTDDGGIHGNDLQHWFEAENTLRHCYRTDWASEQEDLVKVEIQLPESSPQLELSMSEQSLLLLAFPSAILAIVAMPATVDPSPLRVEFEDDVLHLSFCHLARST